MRESAVTPPLPVPRAMQEPPAAPDSAPDAQRGAANQVIGTLLDEHVSLRYVLRVLERVLRDIADLDAAPDFRLICSALYYIDEFPERVHHWKEDNHLFTRLRARSDEFDAVLDRLQGEHARTPQMVALIQRELVHYQGGAAYGLERLRAAFGAYSGMLDEHMRTEERLFETARSVLTDEDWRAIGASFATERDPLLEPGTHDEFQRLRERIAYALPRMMRIGRPPGGDDRVQV
jgi:hemerythrin-like domain-containing protein